VSAESRQQGPDFLDFGRIAERHPQPRQEQPGTDGVKRVVRAEPANGPARLVGPLLIRRAPFNKCCHDKNPRQERMNAQNQIMEMNEKQELELRPLSGLSGAEMEPVKSAKLVYV